MDLLENILSLGPRLVGLIGPTAANLYEAVLCVCTVLQQYNTDCDISLCYSLDEIFSSGLS